MDSSHGGRHARTVAVTDSCVKISSVYKTRINSRIIYVITEKERAISVIVFNCMLRDIFRENLRHRILERNGSTNICIDNT